LEDFKVYYRERLPANLQGHLTAFFDLCEDQLLSPGDLKVFDENKARGVGIKVGMFRAVQPLVSPWKTQFKGTLKDEDTARGLVEMQYSQAEGGFIEEEDVDGEEIAGEKEFNNE
jgi:hypothetical protein